MNTRIGAPPPMNDARLAKLHVKVSVVMDAETSAFFNQNPTISIHSINLTKGLCSLVSSIEQRPFPSDQQFKVTQIERVTSIQSNQTERIPHENVSGKN